MRIIAYLMTLVLLATPAHATALTTDVSADILLRWINGYRHKPEPAQVPTAVKALNRMGGLVEPEKAAVYVGFIAGVIAANPERADALIAKMLPLPAEAQWAIVRAIAYSGAPNWQALMRRFADRLPARKVMIEKYLAGKLPVLDQFAIDKDPAWYEKVQDAVSMDKLLGRKKKEQVKLLNTPELLDTLWGYYFATGSWPPIARILAFLPWSKERDSVDRLTLGNMAKYTLVNNAARDPKLLAQLKYAAAHEPEALRPVIGEVVEAAETADTARVRKEALAAIEEVQRKGPASSRNMQWWGYIGEGAIAVGCVAAAAVGMVALGLPCVVGGATTSYALRTFLNPQ
jgi:hypothetical protein